MAFSIIACIVTCASIAAVTIGIMVYYEISNSKQKKLTYSSNQPVTHDGKFYCYDSETKSIIESNDSNNSLRKRTPKVSPTATEKEKSNDKKSNLSVVEEVQTDFIDIPLSVKEKVDVYFRRQAPATSSDKSPETSYPENIEASSCSSSSSCTNLSSIKSTDDSEKRFKKKVHKSLENYLNNFIQENWELHSAKNMDEQSDTSSIASDNLSTTTTSSSWSNVSSEKSTDDFEKRYKKKLHKAVKKFVKNMNKPATTDYSYGSESSSVISPEELKTCIMCEEKPINTSAKPCNHSYLCSDCIMKYFRISKTCKICHTKINQFIVEGYDK